MRAEDVLYFWFTECGPSAWWTKSNSFDVLIERRFGPVLEQAAAGELAVWRHTDRGRLAEIIVLDQFSRNIFRDSAAAFSCDAMALALSQEAVGQGIGENWPPSRKQFLYMPYMHSESRHIHEQALELFGRPGMEGNLDFELRHKAIIDHFGRYPHRNSVLGRKSTEEELAFLKQPGSSF